MIEGLTNNEAPQRSEQGDERVQTSAPAPHEADERIYVASQWQLMWWRFRKHKMAVASGILLMFLYLIGTFCEFVAPYDPEAFFSQYKLARPATVRMRDAAGVWHWPFTYAVVRTRDPDTLATTYTVDTSKRYPIRLFVRGDTYKFWGLWKSNLHLFGLAVDREEYKFFLFGADDLGRDLFSRIMYGARLSLSVGLIGIALSFVFGIALGGASGYFGGWVDTLVQRMIEFIRSVPSLPLWMGLSAAVPPDWPVVRTYFAITIILSLFSWTGLARVVRGQFLSLREEDFVTAARISGASEFRIIAQHMVPSMWSYVIAAMTLSIPWMILGETSLSFIGLGLRAPAISWGVLLKDAQSIDVLANAPWILLPALFIIVTVTAFNFLGDGIRDAADPYER